jgi:hypothetical protein
VPDQPAAATVRSRYTEQAAADLQDNRRRQQELTEQLAVLQQEEALLVDILALAERFPGPPGTAHATPGAAEPQPRTTGARAEGRQPLLGDLFVDLLREHREPRLAKELRDELLERHPERTPTPQVVRNTLEALVAKGRVRRHKQQRSVMYELPGEGEGDA